MLLIEHAQSFANKVALMIGERTVSYAELDARSASLAQFLLVQYAGPRTNPDLQETAVALLLPPDDRHVVAQGGVLRAGGLCVPIAENYPPAEIERVLTDSGAKVILATAATQALLKPICNKRGVHLLDLDALETTFAQEKETPNQHHSLAPLALPTLDPDRAAFMLFTSGTTSRPKGVVLTQQNLTAQIALLHQAWSWTNEDRALLFLPLHHVHGLVNVLGCGLAAGATITMLPSFDPAKVWAAMVAGEVSVLMAVPTIYHRLIDFFDQRATEEQEDMRASCERVRLMVSGSAALPMVVLERWREISGHTLLERYGMTEIGMALSNPYRGERRAGSVGLPMPTVQVRVRAEHGLLGDENDGEGELEVRGPSVFRGYFGRPQETRNAFTRDGWFLTGDRVRRESGRYKILGRNSIDILKTGGFKVSALEIEGALLGHEAVDACAVVGLPHPEWGDELWAAVEMAPEQSLNATDLRSWLKQRLAPYKVPRHFVEHQLPRNAMGKVVKPELIKALRAAGAMLGV